MVTGRRSSSRNAADDRWKIKHRTEQRLAENLLVEQQRQQKRDCHAQKHAAQAIIDRIEQRHFEELVDHELLEIR